MMNGRTLNCQTIPETHPHPTNQASVRQGMLIVGLGDPLPFLVPVFMREPGGIDLLPFSGPAGVRKTQASTGQASLAS